MKIYKLIANLWPWGNSRVDRRRETLRLPILEKINEAEQFEDRSVPSVVCSSASVPAADITAEVLHVSLKQATHYYSRTHGSRFHRYVVAVDYLLEHEWFWLLTGQHRPPSREQRSHDESQETTWQAATGDQSNSTDTQNQTVCVSESQWSIAATTEPNSQLGSTSSDAE